jgi:succinate dehydrogenase / fumarate reductase, cytochrome b subunit
MFLLLPFIIWLFRQIRFVRDIPLPSSKLLSTAASALPQLVHQFGDFGADLGLFAPPDCRFAPFVHGRDPLASDKEFSRSSAVFTLVLSLGLTVLLGAKLFGVY